MNINQPYASIRVLPELKEGFLNNADTIVDIFKKNNIRVALEIGSWIGGATTLLMGNILKQSGGILYAIDTWGGSLEHQQHPILSKLYQQFLSNMIHWNLTDVVIPCRMRSVEAAEALNVQPDFIYLDGDHSTEAVYADLTAWYPIAKNRSIMCGDDWQWFTVRVAVEKYALENHLRIESGGNFWRLWES